MTQGEALNAMKMGYNVFLTGPPGSGKTFLLNQYVDYLKSEHKSVAVTASTGIAATHMDGTTLHSWSGLGIKDRLTKSDIKKMMKKPYLRRHYRDTHVLIIDEISMLTSDQFDAVETAARYFRKSFEPFGKIQVVCSGDFFQLPPINKDAKFVSESRAWKSMDMRTCYLEEQHRQWDKNLFDLLNHIRDNNIEESKKILSAKKEEKIKDMRTKLYTHNIDVDAVNDIELEKIEGREFVYHMTAFGRHEVVNFLKKSCLAPERLVLKKGAKVMFLKNNFEAGYVNGTQGHVIGFDDEGLPVVKTANGKKITAKVANWTVDEEGKIIARLNQLPLRLAWAITVHKSQGMNLDDAEIDLSKCFVKGMGYVALSRLRSLSGLNLVAINDMAFCVNKEAIEIDGYFRNESEDMAMELRKMSPEEMDKRHREFLIEMA